MVIYIYNLLRFTSLFPHTPVQALVDLVFLESTEEVGDLYLDVAEAYMECGDYTEAKPFLHALTQSNKYNLVSDRMLSRVTTETGKPGNPR